MVKAMARGSALHKAHRHQAYLILLSFAASWWHVIWSLSGSAGLLPWSHGKRSSNGCFACSRTCCWIGHQPAGRVDRQQHRGRRFRTLAVTDSGAEAFRELAIFLEAGPLYGKVSQLAPSVEDWARQGALLASKLSDCTPESTALGWQLHCMTRRMAVRIYHLYLPIYFWMRHLVRAMSSARVASTHRAAVIGLSAPQGCGKTTLVQALVDCFKADNLTCTACSIDDFYLRGEEQDSVAAASAENALLQGRGHAGTHDVTFGETVLRTLATATSGEVAVPVYDKGARGGQGDRLPSSQWRRERMPCDVVLLEGWMAGFKPREDTEALAAIDKGLPAVNERLRGYKAWDDLLDAWCVIGLEDKSHVYVWRLQAERAMAAAGRPGMDDEGVRAFVKRYLPAYEAFCPQLYAAAAGNGIDGKPTLFLYVDGARSPVNNP